MIVIKNKTWKDWNKDFLDWVDCVLHQQGSFGYWRFRRIKR